MWKHNYINWTHLNTNLPQPTLLSSIIYARTNLWLKLRLGTPFSHLQNRNNDISELEISNFIDWYLFILFDCVTGLHHHYCKNKTLKCIRRVQVCIFCGASCDQHHNIKDCQAKQKWVYMEQQDFLQRDISFNYLCVYLFLRCLGLNK